jgi:Domain of unknown function (DUF1906)
MTSLAIDYSYARPSPAAVKTAGYDAVIRYLSGGTEGKDLTAAEADGLLAAGLGIGLVWETTADRALAGAAAGTADGTAAAKQAKALGYPAGAMLLANLGDFAATAAQVPVIHDYYRAFHSVPGFTWQAGGYATAYIIGQLHAEGAEGVWWQNAMDDSGTPGSLVSAFASLYQRVAPTKTIAGTAAGDYDEDVYGFGPAAPVFWAKPEAAPALQKALLVHPDLTAVAVTSTDGKTWS